MNEPCCTPTPTATKRLHVGLAVRDVPEATAFYEALFGRPPVKVRDDYAKFDLRDPDVVLSLVPKTCCGGDRADHFGIRLADIDAVDAAAEGLAARGLTATRERGTCCHAEQDKVWVDDPDGNAWEVYTVLRDRE